MDRPQPGSLPAAGLPAARLDGPLSAEVGTAPYAAEARLDDDAAWVARALAGDAGAFETLVERHAHRVFRLLVGLTGNHADAEDAMQNAFFKAHRHLGEFQSASKFSTWLMRIAINEGVECLRKRRSQPPLEEWDEGSEEAFRPHLLRPWEENPEHLYSQVQVREILEREILKLPAKYRVAVMLRDVEQLPAEEAAAALELPVATLKTRLLRGRLMLRETLSPHFRKRSKEGGGV